MTVYIAALKSMTQGTCSNWKIIDEYSWYFQPNKQLTLSEHFKYLVWIAEQAYFSVCGVLIENLGV